MLDQPIKSAFLTDFGTLFDPPAIQHHHRHGETTIAGAPPARRPIGSALLFECAVAQKGDKALARQWHVDILKAGESKIPAFRQPASCIRIDVATERHTGAAIGGDRIAVKVVDEPGKAYFTAIIASLLRG